LKLMEYDNGSNYTQQHSSFITQSEW